MVADPIRIRVATEEEDLQAYRSWLPQAFISASRPFFFLAEREADGKAVGLGSLRILGQEGNQAGRFQLYVTENYRRQGIGTALMLRIFDHAAKLNAKNLLAGIGVEEASEGKLFFESLKGYEIKETLYVYEVKIDVAWDILNPLVQRLLKTSDQVPDGYEITTLDNADKRNVYQFVMNYLGGIPEVLKLRLRGGKNGFLPKLSQVIRDDKGPLGVLLVRRSNQRIVVESRVVAPKLRGTWVNVVLMYAFIKEVRARGVKKVYFEGDDQLHDDTMKMARRGGCEVMEKKHLFGCEVKDFTVVEK